MSGCTDIVGMQVFGNLTVPGYLTVTFVMLLGSYSLARFRQPVPLSVVLVGCIARILLCVCQLVRKMRSFPKDWVAECIIGSERIKEALTPVHSFFYSLLFQGAFICKYWRKA